MGRLLLVLGGARSGKSAMHNGWPSSWVITSSLSPLQKRGMRTWRNALLGIDRNVLLLGGP